MSSIGEALGWRNHRNQGIASSRTADHRVDVAYSWKRGEPRDYGFAVTNRGNRDAFEIAIQPVTIGRTTFTFEPIPRLHPGETVTARAALAGRTLIDAIEQAIHDRARERKSDIPRGGDFALQVMQHTEIEKEVAAGFANVPLDVTHLESDGTQVVMEYRLAIAAFPCLERVELQFRAQRTIGYQHHIAG